MYVPLACVVATLGLAGALASLAWAVVSFQCNGGNTVRGLLNKAMHPIEHQKHQFHRKVKICPSFVLGASSIKTSMIACYPISMLT